jgi:hypothetical protein
MIHPTDEARWRELEANADLPDVQERIRQEILRGTIRVRPKPGGGIRIMPVRQHESDEPTKVEPPPISSQVVTSLFKVLVPRHRHASHSHHLGCPSTGDISLHDGTRRGGPGLIVWGWRKMSRNRSDLGWVDRGRQKRVRMRSAKWHKLRDVLDRFLTSITELINPTTLTSRGIMARHVGLLKPHRIRPLLDLYGVRS